ncbi:hypothetical protein FRC15_009962 [Serendipita sp. 397]|nr:hypothetical protein FRC15_009962 [Serendipita sp. 397]
MKMVPVLMITMKKWPKCDATVGVNFRHIHPLRSGRAWKLFALLGREKGGEIRLILQFSIDILVQCRTEAMDAGLG